jgi:hypothetical protein
MVESVEMKAKRIRGNKLVKAWKSLSSKPMPKIKALRLSDEDFDLAIKQRRCFEDDLREIQEWGTVLSTKGTDACVFNANKEDAQYVILIRENPFHKMDEIILHELSHIARGDL